MERHDRRGAPALCAETVRINFLSDGELTRALSADEDKNKQDVERYQTELTEWEKNHFGGSDPSGFSSQARFSAMVQLFVSGSK